MAEKIVKSEEEWRTILTPKQFNVLRGKGTEPAFSGKYDANKEKGSYLSVPARNTTPKPGGQVSTPLFPAARRCASTTPRGKKG
jgi:hypothetical protein